MDVLNLGAIDMLMVAVIAIAITAAIVGIGMSIYKPIFFRYAFSKTKMCEGEVTDMHYTPPRTTTTFNGKTTTTTTRPAIHDVYFRTPQKETQLRSVELYQRVRIGEKIKVTYQERFSRPRFWDGEWKPDGWRLVSVEEPDGEVVSFNDPAGPDQRIGNV